MQPGWIKSPDFTQDASILPENAVYWYNWKLGPWNRLLHVDTEAKWELVLIALKTVSSCLRVRVQIESNCLWCTAENESLGIQMVVSELKFKNKTHFESSKKKRMDKEEGYKIQYGK